MLNIQSALRGVLDYNIVHISLRWKLKMLSSEMNSNMICHNNSTHWAPICSALALITADQHAQTLCAQAMPARKQTSVSVILEALWTLVYVLCTECLFDGFFRRKVFPTECIFDGMYFRPNVFSTECLFDIMAFRRNVFSTECLFDGFVSRRNVFSTKCPFDNFFDSSYFRRNVFSTFRRASSGVVLVSKRFN